MKLIFILFLSLSLISCGGESLEEKNKKIEQENTRIANIKLSTCAVLKETTEEQNAFRVKELNSARASIGQEPFIDGDKVIQNAIKFGLCESLVGNDADFKPQFEIAFKKHRKEFIVTACNELDMSYVKDRSTYEDEDDYQWHLYHGFSDQTYTDYINELKIQRLNAYKLEIGQSPYDGSAEDFITLQFLGLCEHLLSNKTDFINKRLSAFKQMKLSYGENKPEISINSQDSYITPDNQVYFLIWSKNEDNPAVPTYFELDTFQEYSDLEFEGIVKSFRFDRLFNSAKKFKFEKNKYKYNESFYNNGNKRSTYLIDDKGILLGINNFFENGAVKEIHTFENEKIKSNKYYYTDGALMSKVNFVNGKREVFEISYGYGGESCLKNGEEVDLEQCK